MYRPSDPQRSLFDARGLLPDEKRRRCEETWAGVFRDKALPILREAEDEFADLFHEELGRPNRPVELVLGVLILKELNDLTDQEALDALEYDLRWALAFERDPAEMHLCQKTLHNFRMRLLEKDKTKLPFRRVTDELARALGVWIQQQRLDSTHILSNIAIRNRLGLFCDTIRVFLRAARRVSGEAYASLPETLRGRYAEDGSYDDAKKKDAPRRLAVVARDVWRLVTAFEKNAGVIETPEWALLKRLFEEQCRVTDKATPPEKGDDDEGDGSAAVEVKEAKEVGSDSLQSAHDPDATYNGKKGKGYEVQVAETCGKPEEVRLITEVDVTPSCQSDQKATVPIVEALEKAGLKPEELVADTAYSGGENAAALAAKEVKLVAPASPLGKPDPQKTYDPPAPSCPTEQKQAVEWLKCQEASPEFKKRYAIRAGIESTNAELKNKHGMGKLRVRGQKRVKLAVYMKALACNLKRALSAGPRLLMA